MKPYGQHTQDLDRVVGIKLMYRLSAHTLAGYQRNPAANQGSRLAPGRLR
jgi:hypothetical protein